MENNKKNNTIKIIAAVFLGACLGAGALSIFHGAGTASGERQGTDEKKPLYWVAPMDASYRRDAPGKSPMGMDLVPVYEDSSATDNSEPGAVKIAPHVVNNLGVRTAPVELNTVDSDIATVGYVQYDEDALVHIHPRVEGWIEKLYVKAAGNPVQQGQPLYTLYSPQLVNAQEEFLIALNRNNSSLIKAAKDRLNALQLSGDFIETLESSRKVQQNVTFFSPQSGVVDGLKIREGFFVKPGTTLMSIGQLDEVWVEAEVFERDAALIEAGLPVSMTLDYLPGKTWQGVVDYVYPTLNDKTRTLRVRLKFANPEEQLKPNMFAQVVIHASTDNKVPVVPKEAVIRTGDQDRVVLALGEGRFKSVEVSIGRVSNNHIEILSGLDENDEVVTSAQFLIDSESSKSSDFKRMTSQEEPDAVWMEGEVNKVMADHSMVNISHGPAEDWDWPAMTMDFAVAESVDIGALKEGQTLHFEVTKTSEGNYAVSGIHIMSEAAFPSATVAGTINAINTATRTVNISRGPIEKWSRPATTMDFVLAQNIDITSLHPGDKVVFTFEVRDDFVITQIAADAPDGDADTHRTLNTDHADHSDHQ